MSLRRGTDLSVVLPSAIRHAARIGSALFLEPEISTLPLRRLPPRIRKLSICEAILGWGSDDCEQWRDVRDRARNRNEPPRQVRETSTERFPVLRLFGL